MAAADDLEGIAKLSQSSPSRVRRLNPATALQRSKISQSVSVRGPRRYEERDA
jgi:hypothetical protein